MARTLHVWLLHVMSSLAFVPCVAGQAPEDAPASVDGASIDSTGRPCELERYVVLEASSEVESALLAEVRTDLAAELGPRGFGVCSAVAATGEVAAEIRLSRPDPATVAIDVDDHTTGKRVGRDVTLARIPTGGRALAIAIAADELLRASWAELVLRRSHEEDDARRARLAPSALAAEERRRMPVSARSSWRYVSVDTGLTFEALVGYAHAGSSWDAASFELRGQVRPFGWGLVALGVGGLRARTVEVALGDAAARGLLLHLTLAACTDDERPLQACAGARGSLFWVQFRGSSTRAAGLEDDAAAFVLSGLGQLRWRFAERLSLVAELGLGGAAVSALATDGRRTLMGIEGIVLTSSLGLGVSL